MPDEPRPNIHPSATRPTTRIDALMALRLGFALVVPALILAWSLVALIGGDSKPVLSSVAGGERSLALGQAGQGTASATPTIEVYDPNTARPRTPTPIPRDERAALFDDVWSTVNRNYIDPDFNGLDWAGARAEYRQRALDAPTPQDFYGAIVDMVALLNDGRSSFTPPASVPMPTAGTEEGGFANIGVTRVFEDNSLLVLYVYPNGPADKGGLKRRDRITAINGSPVTAESNYDQALTGLVGSKVTVTVRSPGRQTRDVTLTREIVVGRAPVLLRQLGEDPTITYLGLPTLGVANVDVVSLYLLDKMHRQHLMQDVPRKGLVVDLRQTAGSSLQALNIILGELTVGTVGRFESRNPGDTVDLDVPLGPLYDKYGHLPLVLMVDGGTRGDAEIMAAALQAQGRARVVGTRTAGNTISNETYTWPDESALTIAQWRFFLPDGSNVDGRGVTPDLGLGADWTEQTGDSDPYIDAAVSLLHSMDDPR